MCEVSPESWNQFISAMFALVAVMLFLVWAIPNGHCRTDCECKKTNRSHK